MPRDRAIALYLTLARLGTFVGLASAALQASAQPVTERILSDAVLTEEARCAHLEIRFNLPVRYLSHFPYETGRDLCIRIRPVAFGANEKAFRFSREALRPPASEIAAIAGIEYQGDAVGGICLNVFFRYPVYYTVAQGSDFRSIEVAIAGPEPNADCKARGGDGPSPPEESPGTPKDER